MSKKITSGYLRQKAELSGVFIFIDGVEYQVDTSELDLNAVIDDIAMTIGADDASNYLYKMEVSNE